MHQRDKSDSITLTKQVELISSLSQSLLVFCHNPNVLLHLPWGILPLPTIKEKTPLKDKHESNMICLNEMLKSVN